MLRAAGQFFDGETAVGHHVDAILDGKRLTIEGRTLKTPHIWKLESLRAAEPVEADRALRLRSEEQPDARLILSDTRMIEALLGAAPRIARPLPKGAVLRFAAVTAAGLLLVAAIGYALLSMLPPAVALVMPEEWRQRLGRQTEEALLGRFSECNSREGLASIAAIGNRLYAGRAEEAPDFTVSVYRLPVINAFALPGGRIVLSGKLIEAAKSPEEVAGVLAHELGHVKNRDPEVAVVRLTGLQVLISLATGSDGGTVLSNLAGLAALLRYTRSAEVKADAYALDLLNQERIDPLGLKRFFESIRVLEEARRPRIGPLGGIIATHPATEERIARIKPLENGPPLPVMSDSQWQALKRICR
jgi:predicted Zn-dependent protease